MSPNGDHPPAGPSTDAPQYRAVIESFEDRSDACTIYLDDDGTRGCWLRAWGDAWQDRSSCR